MQFDEFDKKAKEAADNHHPAYDEQAWTKMEKLLNRHMPEKEDDRRRLLFFLLLLLGIGGIGLLVTKPWKVNKTIAASEITAPQNQSSVTPSVAEQDKIDVPANNNTAVLDNDIASNTVTSTVNNKSVTNRSGANQQTVDLLGSKNNAERRRPLTIIPKQQPKKIRGETNVAGKNWWNRPDTKEKERIADTETVAQVTQKITTPSNDTKDADKKQTELAVLSSTVTQEPKPALTEAVKIVGEEKESKLNKQNTNKKHVTKSKKKNSFFFSISTGPDVSFVNNNQLGATRLLGGGGIGYTFRDRLTIRTGFYSGRKIYSASADSYHPPASFYAYYPYLEKVDANCKVYEIPLFISYNFSRSSKNNWFASAGISSYLMKSETYNYFYKYSPTGSTLNKELRIENINKHYFSGLTLSGGYQQKITPHISLTVEPYFKLPLSGIGFGKVKLNSGGVLFSVGVNPFASKKEKSAHPR